jgi:multiple sugar transport system permease protein
MNLRGIIGKIGLAFAVFVIVSPAILFFLWMASLSVKFEIDNAAYPPVFIPEHFAWKNYAEVVASNRFLTYFRNSLIVTGTATLLAMLVGVPAGYGIARMAAHKSAIIILIARITPGLSYLIPLFLLFQWLGLLGTLWPQIIIHLVVTVHAAGARRGSLHRWRDALAGVSPCRAADRQARARGCLHSRRDLLMEQFCVRNCARRA